MDTLRQLGELLLSSVPAIIGLLIVWTAYRLLVYAPLQRVLAERQTRTEGAIQEAQAQIAVADERTAEYERRLRQARTEIYQRQEANSRRIMQEREAALAQARKKADAMVQSARADLEKEILAAKASLQQQVDLLADEIIESVLRPSVLAGER